VRDEVVDYVDYWSGRASLPVRRLVGWVGIGRNKYYEWGRRYGKANEHNARLPRDFWMEDWEKQAIVSFYHQHPLEGYRRLTYMLIDADVVAVSPASVYRVLKQAGCMKPPGGRPSSKGKAFAQPFAAHQHWHIDISYINICGTFYYLCSVLDGFSRYVVHWEIRESMKEVDVEIVLQRAREKFPEARARAITDNGPQFIAKDFKEFIRVSGMTHVKTSPFHPQSNGKIEAWHKSLKTECIRPKTPLDLEDARRVVGEFVEHYNNERLHSALGYVAPRDKLEGRDLEIFKERDLKLERARKERKQRRREQRQAEVDAAGSAAL